MDNYPRKIDLETKNRFTPVKCTLTTSFQEVTHFLIDKWGTLMQYWHLSSIRIKNRIKVENVFENSVDSFNKLWNYTKR